MTRLGPCPLCDAEGPWENAAARAAHIRAHHTTDCEVCGEPVNASGLDAHMRYMHADEPAPEPEAAQPAAPTGPVDQDPEPAAPEPIRRLLEEQAQRRHASAQPRSTCPTCEDEGQVSPFPLMHDRGPKVPCPDCTAPAPEPAAPTDEEPPPVDVDEDDCSSCAEHVPEGECPRSLRPCGHHCNHSWTHDACDWCGKRFEPEQATESALVEDPAANGADVVHPGDEPQVTEPEQVEEPSPVPDLTCPDCGGGPYADLRGLAGHRRSHIEVTCDECGKKVKGNGIGPHKRGHRPSQVECPDCGRSLNPAGLGTHRAAHRRAAEAAAQAPAKTPEPAAPRFDPSAEVECPDCGTMIRQRGLGAHRAGHRRTAERAAAAPPPPGTLAEVLTAMLPGAASYLVDRIVEFIEQAKEPPAPGLWVVVPLNGTRPWLCRTAAVGHVAGREHAAALVVAVDDIAAELNRPHLKVVS